MRAPLTLLPEAAIYQAHLEGLARKLTLPNLPLHFSLIDVQILVGKRTR